MVEAAAAAAAAIGERTGAAAAVGDWPATGAAQDSSAEAGGLGGTRGRHGSRGLSGGKALWSWFVVSRRGGWR